MKYLSNLAVNYWASVTIPDDPNQCWDWKGYKDKDGYGVVYIKVDGKTVGRRIHRVSYALHFGELDSNILVLHHCDTPGCSNPKHLFKGTQLINIHDMLSKGRACPPKGIKHHNTKLTEADVIYIYTHKNKRAYQLAAQFRVSQPTISGIWNQRTWKHLTDKGKINGFK